MPQKRSKHLMALLFCTFVAPLAARAAAEGALDTNFSGNGQTRIAFDDGGQNQDAATDVAIDTRGRVVLVGLVQVGAASWRWGVARLLPNGEPDPSFGPVGAQVLPLEAHPQRPPRVAVSFSPGLEDLIIVAGGIVDDGAKGNSGAAFCGVAGGETPVCIRRSDDDDFEGWYEDVAIRSDALYLGATWFRGGADYDVMVERRELTSGDLDPTYGSNGLSFHAFDRGGGLGDRMTAMAVTAGGEVVLVGVSEGPEVLPGPMSNQDIFYTKVPASGVGRVFTHFVAFDRGSQSSSRNEAALGVALRHDESFVVAGWSDDQQGRDGVIFDVASNGQAGTAYFDEEARSFLGVALQTDGKPVVAVEREASVGESVFMARRYHRGGSLDTSFGIAGSATYTFTDGPGPGDERSRALAIAAVRGGGMLLAGYAEWNDPDIDFGVMKLIGVMHSDGFEAGHLHSWSSRQP